mgnify:CR=1 FL=1
MVKLFRALVFRHRLKKQIRLADERKRRTGKKQFVINLGCLRYRLTPEQALTAVTLNGAAAICRADRIGSIEPGKQADILIWNAEDLDYICYRFGSNLVHTVMKKGRLVG